LFDRHVVTSFDLCRAIDNSDGRAVLKLVQNSLLGQPPAARRALLYEWYCSNDFVVHFGTSRSATSRSDLERAVDMLDPRPTAYILTPMIERTTPRLYIHCGHLDDGFTFALLLQWVRLFYNGPLSERSLADIETGFGTGAPNHAQYVLTRYRFKDDT
jgi:hypothetical protein